MENKNTIKAKNLYFAYGSNMHLDQMQYRCPQSHKVCNATLDNWTLRERLHADIQKEQGDIVHGVLFNCSDRDMIALDRYEGFPTYYTRIKVWVDTDNGHRVQAIVYHMTPLARHQRDSEFYSEHYRKICSQGAVMNDLDINEFQYASIQASLSL